MLLKKTPARKKIVAYIGDSISAWDEITAFVERNYGFEPVWNYSEKKDQYELKYRRGGKTLVTLYIEKGSLIVLIVFGKAEREKFKQSQKDFSPEIIRLYDNTREYHDGKWLWIKLPNQDMVEDLKKLIIIKRKPKIVGHSG